MPVLKLETTKTIPEKTRTELLQTLSSVVGATLGKPEQYIMVTFSTTEIFMSGKTGDAAFVDLRSIGGLSAAVNRALTEKLCQILEKSLGIPGDRVYVTFTHVEATHWGWKRATFE